MPFIRWLIVQIKHVIGIGICIVLVLVGTALEELVVIWDETKNDTRSILVCTAVAVPIFAIGWHELVDGQSAAGYFHMALAMIPGAPGIRYLFKDWSAPSSAWP